jgi:HK97 family phage major capsid protein
MDLKILADELKGSIAIIRKAKDDLDSKSQDFDKKSSEFTSAISNINSQIKGIENMISEMKSENAKNDFFGKKSDDLVQTPGQIFWKSDDFQELKKKNFNGRIGQVESKVSGGFLKKGIVTSDQLNSRFRIPGVITNEDKKITLLDYLNVIRTKNSQIDTVVEDAGAQLYTTLVSAVLAGASTLEVVSVAGMSGGQRLTLTSGATVETVVVQALNEDSNTITLENVTVNGFPQDSEVTADRFVFTVETKIKPRAKISFTPKTVGMKTLASWVPVSRQAMQDEQTLMNIINGRLMNNLKESIERQVIYGDNSDNQIQGILSHPDVPEYLWSSGAVSPVPDTRGDAIRRAMTLSSVAGMRADLVGVSPNAFENIELEKDAMGRYLYLQNFAGETPVMWRTPVVEINTLEDEDFIVGNFSFGCALYEFDDEESSNGAVLRMTDSHEGNFIKNTLIVLAEGRYAMVVMRPAAFVHGVFDSEPAAP